MFLDKIINTPKQILHDLESLRESELPLILSVNEQYLKQVQWFLLLHDITVNHVIATEKLFNSNSFSYNYPVEIFNDLLKQYRGG